MNPGKFFMFANDKKTLWAGAGAIDLEQKLGLEPELDLETELDLEPKVPETHGCQACMEEWAKWETVHLNISLGWIIKL
jgi:hypothetical protein